jgi:flagellin
VFLIDAVKPSSLRIDCVDVSGNLGHEANLTMALSAIQYTIQSLNKAMADIADFKAKLSFIEGNHSLSAITNCSAFNRITNTSIAAERVGACKELIQQQTSTAILAQANMAPQLLLSLFR